MKHLALLLSVATALVLAPTGAFAKDKHKHDKHYKSYSKNYDRSCDHRGYSRYGGSSYYGRSSYGRSTYSRSYYARPVYYAPAYYAPSYYSGYRGYSGDRCNSYRRGGGVQIVLGF